MRIARWDPFFALSRVDREFDELVRRAWGESITASPAITGFRPATEVVRDGADLLVRFELPGVDVERDVEVTVHDGRLIVSGERKHEKSREHDGALLRELRYGSFRRELVLPAGTTAGQVHASYEAGILTVRVQGAVPVKPEPVRVPVETGAAPEKTLEAGGEQPPN